MNRIALTVSLLLLSTAARADESAFVRTATAYVDKARVYQEAAASKAVTAELQGDADAKQREINAASAAVQAPKECHPGGDVRVSMEPESPACTKAKAPLQAKAQKLLEMDNADFAAHQKKANEKRDADFTAVVAKMKKAKHVATVLPVVPIDAAPGSDWTDAVVKAWDASVQPTAVEIAQLKNQIAQLKADNAKLTKPTTPAVPAPPPTAPQPVAAKGKK